MMVPKMQLPSTSSMVVLNPNVPQMSNLRSGGGSMQTFENVMVPKMQGINEGSHMNMKTGGSMNMSKAK